MKLFVFVLLLALISKAHHAVNDPQFTSVSNYLPQNNPNGIPNGSNNNGDLPGSGQYDRIPAFNRGETVNMLISGQGQGHTSMGSAHRMYTNSGGNGFTMFFEETGGAVGFSGDGCLGRSNCAEQPVQFTVPMDEDFGRHTWSSQSQQNPPTGTRWAAALTVDICDVHTVSECSDTCQVLPNGNGINGATGCPDDVICAPADGIGQCDQNGMINGVCTNGMCECVPDADPCGNAVCGMVNDGCGNFMSCGDCVDPTPFCTVGTCTATECIPDTDCITDSNDPQCGVISDGCAASVDCGGCSAGEFDVCDASSSCVNAQGQTPSEAAAAGQSSSAVFLTFSAVLVSFLAFLLF